MEGRVTTNRHHERHLAFEGVGVAEPGPRSETVKGTKARDTEACGE